MKNKKTLPRGSHPPNHTPPLFSVVYVRCGLAVHPPSAFNSVKSAPIHPHTTARNPTPQFLHHNRLSQATNKQPRSHTYKQTSQKTCTQHTPTHIRNFLLEKEVLNFHLNKPNTKKECGNSNFLAFLFWTNKMNLSNQPVLPWIKK